jgi:P27 family predicted phage terminase small subunit
MGRRPTPTALKVLRGTDRPDRANPEEPTPPALEVGAAPPAWLRDRRARAYWRELVPILSDARMLAMTDTTALVILAKAYGRWRDYEDFLETNGETYDSKPGPAAATPSNDEQPAPAPRARPSMLRPRPEVAMRDKAEDRLVLLLGKFGMTPSDRTRVAALPRLIGDPSEDFLRARRRA